MRKHVSEALTRRRYFDDMHHAVVRLKKRSSRCCHGARSQTYTSVLLDGKLSRDLADKIKHTPSAVQMLLFSLHGPLG